MASRSLPKRAATAAAIFGVTALAGAAPALAAPAAGQHLYGSGSSLQKLAQQNIWIPTFDLAANTTRRPGLTNNPGVTYDSTSSGQGLAEFGNAGATCNSTVAVSGGVLNPVCDPAAQASGVGPLDGFVGSDDPPTGSPTDSSTQLGMAHTAAGGSVDELTIPVAQAPVSIPLSLPSGITVGAGTKISLTTAELNSIWDENVTHSAHYSKNTWGAVLEGAGLKLVASSPVAGQFSDDGSTTGAKQGITLQARSSGSGTSYTFKGYLFYAGAPSYTINFQNDANNGPNGWPFAISTVTCRTQTFGHVIIDQPAGNSGGSGLVQDTASCPGSIGYANLADAANPANGGFTGVAQTSTFGGSASHDIQYAYVQDNAGHTPAHYASPAAAGANNANVYTGANININGQNPAFVGHWTVPYVGGGVTGTFDPTGTWGGTNPSDPDVYDHSGRLTQYPIVAATYDLAWNHYNDSSSNLVGPNGYGSPSNANAVGATTASYMFYLTSSSTGQIDLGKGGFGIPPSPEFYARLPAKIDTYAHSAASAIVK